jgi:hypothetical protein
MELAQRTDSITVLFELLSALLSSELHNDQVEARQSFCLEMHALNFPCTNVSTLNATDTEEWFTASVYTTERSYVST